MSMVFRPVSVPKKIFANQDEVDLFLLIFEPELFGERLVDMECVSESSLRPFWDHLLLLPCELFFAVGGKRFYFAVAGKRFYIGRAYGPDQDGQSTNCPDNPAEHPHASIPQVQAC